MKTLGSRDAFWYLKQSFKCCRFAQKQMKSGLGKNGGGGNRGFFPPPRTPFVLLNSYPTLPKFFLEKLEYICRSNKKYFWPNCLPAKYTSAWKKCCQNGNFHFTPFVLAGNDHNVSKKFWANVLTLYSSNQGFVRIKNQK
jgi:hypothetical protein